MRRRLNLDCTHHAGRINEGIDREVDRLVRQLEGHPEEQEKVRGWSWGEGRWAEKNRAREVRSAARKVKMRQKQETEKKAEREIKKRLCEIEKLQREVEEYIRHPDAVVAADAGDGEEAGEGGWEDGEGDQNSDVGDEDQAQEESEHSDDEGDDEDEGELHDQDDCQNVSDTFEEDLASTKSRGVSSGGWANPLRSTSRASGEPSPGALAEAMVRDVWSRSMRDSSRSSRPTGIKSV